MKKLILIAVVALALTGCAQQSFLVKQNATSAPKQVTTHHFFLSGLGQSKTIDATAVCHSEDNLVRVEVQQTPLNVLLSIVTFGIYTPREARVYCSI